MRNTAFAGVAAVMIAGATSAGTPAAEDITMDEALAPISAMFPPLSEDELHVRCHGFFRTIEVRTKLAQSLGQYDVGPFAFVAELPVQRLKRPQDGDAGDYITPYMQAFGPLDPPRTAQLGLFHSDRKTCTEFLDALG